MRIAPGKQELQDRMELRQSRLAGHQHSAPDERADAAQDDPQLVDAEWCRSGSHTLRVAQSPTPLKGVPRYLTLSTSAQSSDTSRRTPVGSVPQRHYAGHR